jgi:hypothetical protein
MVGDCRLPGDYGFDPLGLGEEPASLKWYVQAELVHCRFAMAGVAGILFTDVSCLSYPFHRRELPILTLPLQQFVITEFDLTASADYRAVKIVAILFIYNLFKKNKI